MGLDYKTLLLELFAMGPVQFSWPRGVAENWFTKLGFWAALCWFFLGKKKRQNTGFTKFSSGPRKFRHRIWPGEGPLHHGNDPPPAPGRLKTLLFPSLLNKVQNKGTQGVWARYGAELPPFISIVRYPGRPVILGMENLLNLFFRDWPRFGEFWYY